MPARSDFGPGEFCWIDLASAGLEEACEWYGGLFGWTAIEIPGREGPPYRLFMKGEACVGGIGELSEEMKAQGIPPCWNSYVNTADCEATEAKVRELGGTVTVPTMDLPGFGKLAFFLDREGASFAAWQSTSKAGPPFLVKDPGSLSWNELMIRNKQDATDFYGELFGWNFASLPMGGVDYTLLKNGEEDGGGIMPMEGEAFEGVPAHWLVYFEVADCKAATAKAASTGGKVNVPPTEIPVGEFSVVSDPQGGVFALITVKGDPA